MYVSNDKSPDARTDFFDMSGRRIENLRMKDPNSDTPPSLPINFELMKKLAQKLSAGIPHLRVDFYEVNGKVLAGEMTFYHCSGFATIHPDKWNYTLGEWIDIS